MRNFSDCNPDSYVFSSTKGHIHPESISTALKRLGYNRKERGTYQRAHSFRKTFRSLAQTYQQQHQQSYQTMEIALDHHDSNSTALAYSFKADYTKQLKELMDWWSSFILKLKS
jgi:integrase